MTFISYAQNFEDVMLWRALKHVENGFYIDVGAQDPVIDSVSLAFYERGWRGVHVEPSPQYSARLRKARPDENVMQVAIGCQNEPIVFYEFKDTGLSTGDATIAYNHQKTGHQYSEIVVQVLSMDALLEGIGSQEVHWLKLDVEGLETSVLQSWKNSSLLPWVLVIESTRPLTQEESYSEWESILITKGYCYVYFDGLNRYYVSADHKYLVSAFKSPPNIFDDFVLSGSASQPFYKLVASKAQEAETKAAQQISEIAKVLEDTRHELHQILQANHYHWQLSEQRQQQVEALYRSRSWRMTEPLRWLSGQAKGIRSEGIKSRLKAFVNKVFRKLDYELIVRPTLRHQLISWSHKLGVHESLKSNYRKLQGLRPDLATGIQLRPSASIDLEHLTTRARQIYKDLKLAVERTKEG